MRNDPSRMINRMAQVREVMIIVSLTIAIVWIFLVRVCHPDLTMREIRQVYPIHAWGTWLFEGIGLATMMIHIGARRY